MSHLHSMSLLMLLLWASLLLQDTCSFTTTTTWTLTPLRYSRIQRNTGNGVSPFFASSMEENDTTIAASATTTTTTQPPRPSNGSSLRRVASIEKFSRLPVWPVWVGVIIFVAQRLLGNEMAAKLEDAVGGRVCPNFFQDTQQTSPFIMLVHHRHSFWNWDLIRYIQRTWILPEGFPAHPHRGFTTLTYFLKGGFQHRDSLGIQQNYGAPSSSSKHHSQWLFTGAGLLHEEMFDDSTNQELYQLWINVPSAEKLQPPSVDLLGQDECPVVVVNDVGGQSETVVLAGTYQGKSSKAPTMSDLSVFHVRIQAASNGGGSGNTWKYTLPKSYETVILYIRQGSCDIAGTAVPVHHTVYLEAGGGDDLVVTSETGVDFLLLAGDPLREPVAAQGSMVMTTGNEINQAYLDYQYGYMGKPWDHKLNNEEWKAHLEKFPCKYRYNEKQSEK